MTPNKTNLYAYLDKLGVLEHGTDAEIKAAKRAYRRKYITAYRRTQREDNPEYPVSLSRKNGDYGKIHAAAKAHSMRVGAFLRTATLAYLDRAYILPSRDLLVRLDQLLMDCLNEVRSIVHVKAKHHWQHDEKIDAVAKRISRLQYDVQTLISEPVDIETAVAHAIAKTPAIRDALLGILAHAG